MKSKLWRHNAPKTISDRRSLLARCGKKAFLNPEKLSFPIMAKSGPCKPDCKGLRAAYARAKQFKHTKVASKASKLASKVSCSWI